MPDILLIQPPIQDFYLTAKRTIPYGLACIASSLEYHGFTVDIFDGLATSKSRCIELPPEMGYLKGYYPRPDRSPFGLFHRYRHYGYSFEHIGTIARRSQAPLVGISSLFSPYAQEALKTAEAVKRFHPTCQIVMGGHHPTSFPKEVLACDAVDYVLRGEGELSLPILARALRDQTPLATVPGLAYRGSDGRLVIAEPAVMSHPDDYPLPAMNLVKHQYYQRAGKGSTVISASRGCPMKCSYCSTSATSYLTYRRRSVASVLAEIERAVKRFGAGFIDFEDENLTLNRSWFLELMAEIQNRYGTALELRAMNGLYPPSLDEEIVIAMKNAGFTTLNLSLCSTSASQLKRFNRPNVCRAFDRVLDLAEKYQLDAVGYIIVGSPYQVPAESLADLLFLAQRRVLAGVSVYYPAPGSKDYAVCAQLGMLPTALSLGRSSALPLSHTTTRRDSLTLLRLGRIINFLKHLANLPPNSVRNEKEELGLALLEDFFKEGRIKGITPEGELYDHEVSQNLTQSLSEALKRTTIVGTVTRAR